MLVLVRGARLPMVAIFIEMNAVVFVTIYIIMLQEFFEIKIFYYLLNFILNNLVYVLGIE